MEPTGRVLQVNISQGGVPKLPIPVGRVTRLGLEGDRQREYSVHGGPHKALCLFAIEQIERLRSEGHPVEPGSVGENLTTTGVEWSLLPVGTRARIGPDLEIELSQPANPCSTQRRNFSDGRFSRIAIDHHPSDSRMYARVLREGEVRPGDPVTILPVAADSEAAQFLILKRLDRVERKSSVAAWAAAKESGISIDFVEDGDLSMSVSSEAPGPAFNHVSGLAQYPNLLPLVTAFYDRHSSPGWLWCAEEPWTDAQRTATVGVFGALPAEIAQQEPVAGLVVREIGPDDAPSFNSVTGSEPAGGGVIGVGSEQRNPWHAVYTRLARWPHRHLFLAELHGEPVGVASLHTNNRAGWLRGALVAPHARGLGIQRALISARVRKAQEEGCDLVGSWAEPDGPSALNLQGMGLRRIGLRHQYLYEPAAQG